MSSNHGRFNGIKSNEMEWHKSWLTVDISHLILLIIYFNWNSRKKDENQMRIWLNWIENEQLLHSMPSLTMTMHWKSNCITHTHSHAHSASLKTYNDFHWFFLNGWFSFEKRIHLVENSKKRENISVSDCRPFSVFVFFFCDLKSTSYGLWCTMGDRHTLAHFMTLQEIS